jgi:hypothetical protein
MRRIIPLYVIISVLVFAQPVVSQTRFDFGVWTEFYTYKVPLPNDDDQTQIRSLQGMRFRVGDAFVPGLNFFFRGRVASDLSNKFVTDPDFRIFGAYLEYLKKDLVTIRAGRQFVSAGIGGFTMDGGRLDLSYKGKATLTGFAGATPGPTFYDYDRASRRDERGAFGGRFVYGGLKGLRPAISFLQRNVNENVDTRTGGFDYNLKLNRYYENARLDYDMLQKRVAMAVTRTGLVCNKGHRLEFEYMYRRPILGLSSFFSSFRSEPFHQIRLTPIFRANENIYLQGSLAHTIFEDDYNTRVAAGGSYKGQTVGVVFSTGYAGTQLGAYGFLSHNLNDDLRAFLSADMYNYKLDTEEDDTDPSVATAFGATFNFLQHLTSRAELQFLSNRDFKYDTRFYIRLGYNFATRFRTTGFGGGYVR